MSLFSGIIGFLFVFYFMFTIQRQLRCREDLLQRTIKSAIFAAVVAFMYALASKVAPVIAILFMFAIMIMMVYLLYLWNDNGESLKEMLTMIVLDLVLMIMASANAARILDITSIRWIVGIIRVLPGLMFVVSVAFFIVSRMYFLEWTKSDEFDEKVYLDGTETRDTFKAAKKESLNKRVRRWILDEDETCYCD